MKIDKQIISALEASGRPWELVEGSRHVKVRVDGHLVAILPLTPNEANRRAVKNCLSQIKRASRGIYPATRTPEKA